MSVRQQRTSVSRLTVGGSGCPAGGDSYVVDGVLQVQDAVFQRVADVVFRIAGCGHLLIESSFHQLLVLQHQEVNVTLVSLWTVAPSERFTLSHC